MLSCPCSLPVPHGVWTVYFFGNTTCGTDQKKHGKSNFAKSFEKVMETFSGQNQNKGLADAGVHIVKQADMLS